MDAQGTPHLGDLVVEGSHAWIANSFAGVTTFSVEAQGLELITELPGGNWWADPFEHCTALTLHAPSSTLFCASPYGALLIHFDVSDPAAPTLRTTSTGLEYRLRDVLVVGDLLLMAAFADGLRVADIGADGSLSNLRTAQIDGDLRALAGDGEHVAALALDRGLLALSVDGDEVTELGAVELDGPKLDLVIREGRAVAALGSAGVAVVSLAGAEPVVETMWTPPAVVVSADVDGDAAAAMTLTGVYLYDLARERVVGFDRAVYAMLSGRFVEGDLVVTDWERVLRYAVDLGGEVTTVDAPHGIFVTPEQPVQVPVFNPGAVALRAEVLGTSLEVGPGEQATFSFDAETVLGARSRRQLDVRTSTALDPGVYEPQRRVELAVRTKSAERPESYPTVGDPVPEIALADDGGRVFFVPDAGEAVRLVFFVYDCSAMWPELEDLAWAARAGRDGDDTTPVFITGRPNDDELLWGYDDLTVGYYDARAEDVPTQVADFNARLGNELYDDGFANRGDLPRAASHPTDHLVDADGTVFAIDMHYRGSWPLRPAP